jgi:hypothetical protein
MQGSGDVTVGLSYPTLVGHIHLNNNYIVHPFKKVINYMWFIILLHI